MTLVASPGHLGGLVVEETGTESTGNRVLETEPLKGVRFLTLTSELLGSPFGLQVVHGVVPGLARVCIDIPAVLGLVLSPIWDTETLEDSSWATIERNISDTLKKSVWVEVLSVHVMHHIRFFVELVAIDVLDTKSYIIIKIKISTRTRKKHDRKRTLGCYCLDRFYLMVLVGLGRIVSIFDEDQTFRA